MKIGKIIATTACSLLMSSAAFAEIAPAPPADNSVFELSVVSEKISAANDDYGTASSILGSFYDSSTGQAGMEQTPVYAGGDCIDFNQLMAEAVRAEIPLVLEISPIPGEDALKDISKAIRRVCVASHQKKVCISREVCEMVCSGAIGVGAGAIGGGGLPGAVVGGVVGVGSVPVCKKVCRSMPECSMVTVCDRFEMVETNGSFSDYNGTVTHQ